MATLTLGQLPVQRVVLDDGQAQQVLDHALGVGVLGQGEGVGLQGQRVDVVGGVGQDAAAGVHHDGRVDGDAGLEEGGEHVGGQRDGGAAARETALQEEGKDGLLRMWKARALGRQMAQVLL